MEKKEIYERKKEWAARRMADNKEIETLTEEQHELLERLCTFRHDLHTNWDSAFCSGSGDYDKYANEICVHCVGMENDLYTEVKEAFGKAPFTPIDYPDDYCYDVLGYESVEEAREEAYKLFEQVNEEIEAFLYSIDKEHGTDYCPSGYTRI